MKNEKRGESEKIPPTMEAAVAQERGSDLHVISVATPTPGPGQVLVRVEAAAVNFSDVKRLRGDTYPFPTSFPFVPGSEIAGVVVAHGPGVEGPKVGTRVFALAGAGGLGGYAQYALAYAVTAGALPPGLSTEAASVLLVAGTTAKLLLREAAGLTAGQTVFIPAATGGVGSFCVQLARRMEAKTVIAGVGGPAKLERARALGAHEVLDTSDPEWPQHVRELTGGRGVDVALEATGGACLEETLSAVGPFGRLVVYGAASGINGSLSAEALERWLYAPAPNQTLTAFNLGSYFVERPQLANQALGELIQDVLSERIRVPSLHTMPLRQANDAHHMLQGRQVEGKLVLLPWA